jgi:hypothetical protein
VATRALRLLRRATYRPTEEAAIPTISRTTPISEQSAPRRATWALWSLGAALVALAFELALEIGGLFGGDANSGPIWLQGRFLHSWPQGVAFLLIAFAVAAGVRSLALIRRGAATGLGFTASGLLVSSAALVVGRAILVGLLGVTASLVVYGICAGNRGSRDAVATNATFVPGRTRAADPAADGRRARMSGRQMAILALAGALLGPPLSWVALVGALVGIPLSLAAYPLAIVALRRIRATGEAGRGWAISAIAVSSVWLVLVACVLLMMWLLSQVQWA